MCGIYKITNLINGKSYIGQSKNIEERWKVHKSGYLNPQNVQYNCVFYRAIRKYGIENFSFEIIEECDSDFLNEREKFWIAYYKTWISHSDSQGYNMTRGGDSSVGTLSSNQVEEIIKLLLDSDLTQAEIANKFNISQVAISDINIGHSYYQDKLNYPIRNRNWTKNQKIYTCPFCGNKKDYKANICRECYNKERIKDFPSRSFLKEEIRKKSFEQIGREHNVTGNAVKKWCKKYNLPYLRKEINCLTEEEWKTI